MDEGGYVPTSPGKIILSHWSNGQPLWSGGPPQTDAKLLVSYVKAYFNSSDPARQKDYALRCKDRNARGAVCTVPEQHGPPTAASSYFFSQDTTANKVVNQSISALKRKSSSSLTSLPQPIHIHLVAIVATLWILVRE